MVLATMPSKFLGTFQTHPFLLDPAYPEPFWYEEITVDPLPVDRFNEIICGPAGLVGLAVDDELVERMVKDTGTRDALPLLADTLRRLWVIDWKSRACRIAERNLTRDEWHRYLEGEP